MVRGRLFIKVYLTLLACLAAVTIASGLYWRATVDRDELSWTQRRDLFLEEMLRADDPPLVTQQIIRRFANSFEADIALYTRDGRLITAAGNPVPFPDERVGRRLQSGPRGEFAKRLHDGRVVAARIEMPWQDRRRRPLGYLLLVAAIVGLAAYPVVRHLTRRLETLREGVERFGEGSLATRVPVTGKDEIAAVATSFNRAAERIEGLVQAHRSLLANASHELRAPVTRLRMAVELDDMAASGPAHDEILGNLAEIDQLVDEILLASRLDHVGMDARTETVDLMALAAEESARHGIEPAGVSGDVRGDPRLLTRLVRNLLINAARHGRPPIEVTLSVEGANTVLAVRDHGSGVPADEQEKVFQPFYRPKGRSEAAGGWGLGLALVRQIAELHGGGVTYRAPPDGPGALFLVTLPLEPRKKS